MRLTVQMDSHGFADLTKKDLMHDAGTVTAVRSAGPADLEAIVAIEQASGRGPFSPSAMAAAVADPDRHVVPPSRLAVTFCELAHRNFA